MAKLRLLKIKWLFTAILVVTVVSAGAAISDDTARMRTVTDLNGRSVTIPETPKRIACFFGPSYEKVFLLGAADRVAMMSQRKPPWSYFLNPALKNIPVIDSYTSPNIEKMLESKIDLVFYWQMPKQIETMTAAGIPVVCASSRVLMPETADQFINKYKEEIRFYGKVLGPESQKIAEKYCAYFDACVGKIVSKTSAIPVNMRPKVYYTIGRNIFSTQGKYSLVYWQVAMAGGVSVAGEMDSNFVDITAEQIISWNPDIIILDDMTSESPAIKEPIFQTLNAVKKGKVYICPEGVFSWGKGSSESILLLIFLAKSFHPDLFGDIDMMEETQKFYELFYHYRLTDDETRRILDHLPPAIKGKNL